MATATQHRNDKETECPETALQFSDMHRLRVKVGDGKLFRFDVAAWPATGEYDVGGVDGPVVFSDKSVSGLLVSKANWLILF